MREVEKAEKKRENEHLPRSMNHGLKAVTLLFLYD